MLITVLCAQHTASDTAPPCLCLYQMTGRLIPRLNTFAIGPYCNHYFLKQLATYGRGAFDVAFRPHAIQVTGSAV